MSEMNQYENLGQWIQKHFSVEVIVCRVFVKRWAFEWCSTPEIMNARRLQLTANTGIIISNEISDERAEHIKTQALHHWQNL